MSNVNDYAFSKKLDVFKAKILDPQIERVNKAQEILKDPNHIWRDDDQKKAGQSQYDNYKAWLAVYQTHYDEGMRLCAQHERLVDKLSKWYDKWYSDISNDGKQEIELMQCQADWINEIFSEIYNELKVLNLDGMKQPQALNLK